MNKSGITRSRIALLTVLGALGLGAYAQSPSPSSAPTPAPALSLDEIERRLAAEGLTVRELEVRGRRIEVEAYDADGKEVDLVIDRSTGETLSRKVDD